MLSSLSCPTCGAPAADPNAVRCDYCGSTLTTVACPKCFGTMFAGMDFCPHCGAKADRTIIEGGPTLACPGCKSDMRNVAVGDTAMHECPQCSSLWLDAPTFSKLCVSREERGAVIAFVDVGKAQPQTLTVSNAAVRYVPCPVCRRMMNRQNFGRRSGVIVDVCKGHGVWFEAHELQAVLAFIESGGFEKARAEAEAEKTAEQVKLQKQFEQSGKAWMQIDITTTRKYAIGKAGQSSNVDSHSLIDDALRMLFS